jgi:pentatricopeptide repeat protein
MRKCYDKLFQDNFTPDDFTFLSIGSAIRESKDLDLLTWAFTELKKHTTEVHKFNIRVYNSILAGFYKAGSLSMALEVHKEMLRTNLQSNSITFSNLLSCSIEV